MVTPRLTWLCPGAVLELLLLWPASQAEPLRPFECFSRALTRSCPRPVGATGSKVGHKVLLLFSGCQLKNIRCKGFKVSFFMFKNAFWWCSAAASNLPFVVMCMWPLNSQLKLASTCFQENYLKWGTGVGALDPTLCSVFSAAQTPGAQTQQHPHAHLTGGWLVVSTGGALTRPPLKHHGPWSMASIMPL